MSTPVPMTATVMPPPTSAPRWAAASQPRARPLTTMTPARARSAASCSATASPYGDGRREPTIATRGPSGGGHVPRVFSEARSGGDVMQPVSQRLENVAVPNQLCALEVCRRARDPPGPMKAPRGETLLLGPALEGAPRGRLEGREVPQLAWPDLCVEAALTLELPASRRQYALPDNRGPFASRLGGELRQGHATHANLEIDAVEQRAGQPALVRINHRRGASAGPNRIAGPTAGAGIRGRDQREARGIGDRAAGARDRYAP